MFRRQAERYGARPALIFNGESVTYGALNRTTNRVAQAMLAAGVQPGERVAILAKNSARYFAVLGGAIKARSCLCPINFRLTVNEIAFILRDMTPKIMFVSHESLAIAQQASVGLHPCPQWIVIDAPPNDPESYEQWLQLGVDTDPYFELQADEDAFLLYTSGTTGQPKGVRITHRNYAHMLESFAAVPGFAYRDGDTVTSMMPLFHIAGINVGMAGLSQGCTVWPISDFSARPFLELLENARVNHAFLAPAMIAALLQAPEAATTDFGSLTTIAYGGAPIAPEVLLRAQSMFGCGFVQLYGMTESSGAGTYLDAAAHEDPSKHGSCGVAWPGMEFRVVDERGNDLAANRNGELLMRGGFLMPGYRNRPLETREAICDGWLRTGDTGYRDDDGFVFIRDRMKDIIVSGGENISPTEVENAIFGCPGVADVAVIGIPSAQWGEEVKAIVVLSPGASADADGIIAWTKRHIAAYKAPKSVDFVGALPRNAAGKILKRELRAPYWQGRARQVN